MNKNDIIAALFANEITTNDLLDAVSMRDSFNLKVEELAAAGLEVTVTPKALDPTVKEVARRLNVDAIKVHDFKAGWSKAWHEGNKIIAIKNCRVVTGCGLADAKWACEMLFDGHSMMEGPVRR